MDTRALYVGRFQPYHLGHHCVIKRISSEVDEVVVGVGSAQISHEVDDPFTGGERYLMISESLKAEGISNYYIVPIIDINRNAVWVSHVESLIPPVKVVYTNSSLIGRLFLEKKYDVRRPPLYDREKYSGNEVRRCIVSGERWEDLVSETTANVIKEIDGVNRMKEITKCSPG
ncbi:MAG: nicotinamide-nucleotide adenylyltransferase [Halobacteriota archaeon]|nr:nicotinamide-nucleotide adenylyltransferase [Halobacteriota archaeon]